VSLLPHDRFEMRIFLFGLAHGIDQFRDRPVRFTFIGIRRRGSRLTSRKETRLGKPPKKGDQNGAGKSRNGRGTHKTTPDGLIRSLNFRALPGDTAPSARRDR
jgi:hypothetical protein